MTPEALLRTILLVLVTFGAVACESSTAAPGMGTLEIGTGESAFEPIEGGERLHLVHGVQGGYHVWLSLRGSGLDPAVTMTLTMTPGAEGDGIDGGSTEGDGIDGGRVGDDEINGRGEAYADPEVSTSRASIRLEETPSDPDFDWIFIGWPAVLRNPGCFVDRPLRISVRLRDKGGRIAQDERTIVPTGIHLPPCTPK